MIRLRDVAEQAGVSVKTASVVLGGMGEKHRISLETQERILKTAKRLNYHRDTAAQSLRSGKRNMIGVIYHSYPQHRVIRTRAAAQAIIEANYQVSLQDVAWHPERESICLKNLLGLRVDGILLESGASPAGVVTEANKILADLSKRKFPMVRLDESKGLPIDVVTVDREHGAFLATQHLLSLGHRRIAAAIDFHTPYPFLQQRIQGYCRAHQEWGVPVDENLFVANDPASSTDSPEDKFASGKRAMARMLSLPARPTAMLAANDYGAMGAINGAIERGLQVPGDIAVVGFTGASEADLSPIPVTTMAYPAEQMAQEAVRLLLERISGSKEPPRVVTLMPELIVRRSCGADRNYGGIEEEQNAEPCYAG